MDNREMIGTGAWLKFIWKGHVSNWFWSDRLTRRIRRNMAWGEYKMSYLQKYAGFARNLKAENSSMESEGEKEEEKIFLLWLQGEEGAPEIVRKCIDSIRDKYPRQFIMLTRENLFDYIRLPDYIMGKWEQGKIGAANFSDLVRIELLYNHGGYWFDATDFLTGEIPDFITESPFFLYVASDSFYPHMFVQTCFMRGKRHDPLMGMWRRLAHEYWRKEEKACDYFLVHMLLKLLVLNNSEAKFLFDRMPHLVMEPTHELWYKTGNLPYSPELYRRMCKDTFFQKCSYKKSKNAVNDIIPGSMADMVINQRIDSL